MKKDMIWLKKLSVRWTCSVAVVPSLVLLGIAPLYIHASVISYTYILLCMLSLQKKNSGRLEKGALY